jgi:tRNA modification GTPase
MGGWERPPMLEDTIIAISTPPGHGGLGVIRISGKRALAVARKIFRTDGATARKPAVRRAEFGRLFDKDRKIFLDEGFLTYFEAPHSYTGEEVVEFTFHGSPVVLETAVKMGVGAGARAAQPGEFTLRAYLNGRIDILQAEAVNDLIRAVSPAQALVSFKQVSGTLSRKIRAIRDMILGLVAQVEASIEFPEDGLRLSPRKHLRLLDRLATELERLVGSYERGKALGGNLTLAIVGRPNVGKSTLFNALLDEERAIVTPYPGTTRDYLREKVVVGDAVFTIVDMAGLGSPGHAIEKAGMAKGRRIAAEADGLILVLDGSRRVVREDESLLRRYSGRNSILVINKCDLPRRASLTRIQDLVGEALILQVSALRGDGLRTLRKALCESFVPSRGADEEIILHLRQKDILEEILKALRNTAVLIEEGQPEEIVAEGIRAALPLMGRLTGEIRTEEVMNDIFGRFCVGK